MRFPDRRWIGRALLGSAAVLGTAAVVNAFAAKRAERAHPPKGRFVTVDGVDLHVLERGGGGDVVVLIHGNGAMIEDMTSSGLVDDLARDHRVVVFDRPGFGFSQRPRGTLWTAAAQARLLRRALGTLGVARATVVGHSFGALVAAELALLDPGFARALVLVSGYLFPKPRVDMVTMTPPAVPIVGDLLRYTISPPLSALLQPGFYEALFGPAPIPDRFRREFPHALLLRPGQLRAVAADTAFLLPGASHLQSRVGDLTMPLTIIAGLGDRIVEPEQSMRLHRAVPGSRLVTVPGVGHMVHHSALARVAEAIRAAA